MVFSLETTVSQTAESILVDVSLPTGVSAKNADMYCTDVHVKLSITDSGRSYLAIVDFAESVDESTCSARVKPSITGKGKVLAISVKKINPGVIWEPILFKASKLDLINRRKQAEERYSANEAQRAKDREAAAKQAKDNETAFQRSEAERQRKDVEQKKKAEMEKAHAAMEAMAQAEAAAKAAREEERKEQAKSNVIAQMADSSSIQASEQAPVPAIPAVRPTMVARTTFKSKGIVRNKQEVTN
ncbi:CS domain [Carpediemonas membranifera]|uniref:CS domain n=1 Tax=Carpediemonas membranifera TaxID=201153 RepID=A0A8J6B395_9EUKA|nr:CS domain [Carpediemonas membranifera]|eukprot:KAG9392042.1 CS domain [Carpediemonas membranifera]